MKIKKASEAKSSRRGFLKRCSLGSIAILSGTEILADDSAKDLPEAGEAFLHVLFNGPDGLPIPRERLTTLTARDLAGDPLPQKIILAAGRARVQVAAEPIQIGMRLTIPGFGESVCYADNDGAGYARPVEVDFVTAAAQTRILRVTEKYEAAKRAGLVADSEVDRCLAAARELLPKETGRGTSAKAYDSLANGLRAGERLVICLANHRISKFSKPRTDFLFGCKNSQWSIGELYTKRFTELFNYATISWYIWNKYQSAAEHIDYGRMDQSLQWCETNKILPKGFGYVYLVPGAMPEWLRALPYEKVKAEYLRVVTATAKRYAGRVPVMEIINEVHDKSNYFHYSHAQILDLTRAACEAARAGNPNLKNLINHCCLWAEYAKKKNDDGSRRWSPYRYLKDCESAGVPFDVIGLQLYYPGHDLFEIEREIDRFADFKRPLQISEISCSSNAGLDAKSMRPTSESPQWHGPWTEDTQAAWAEAIYTMIYSKTEFNAITWWDFADVGGQFWPYGGLLNADLSPKKSYRRLLSLKERWGLG